MFMKIVGNMMWVLVVSVMSYMVYTGNFAYLNVLDAYFYLLMLIGSVTVPLLWMVMLCAPDEEKVQDTIQTFAKKVNVWSLSFTGIKSAVSLVLMAMCGYAFVLAYVIILEALTVRMYFWCDDKVKGPQNA